MCCGWWDVSHPFQSGFICVVVGGMSATTFRQDFFVLWLVGCQPPFSVRSFVCCGWWDVSHLFQSGVFCVVVGGMSATPFSQEFCVLWLVGCQPPLSVRSFLCCGWGDVSHPFQSGCFCVVVGGMSVTVVSKSGNPGPGPVPNSYFLYYIFIKALILIKFEHNA